MNKFYFFTLSYYCLSVSEDKKGFEIISGSTLISIYITLWDFIVFFFKEINLDILYIIQMIFSGIPSLLVACYILLVVIMTFLSVKDPTYLLGLFCCIMFFFGGGLWYDYSDDDSYCDCYNCCECCDCTCDCKHCSLDCDICCFSCIGKTVYCDCCCCDKTSCYYSTCCNDHCSHCELCRC